MNQKRRKSSKTKASTKKRRIYENSSGRNNENSEYCVCLDDKWDFRVSDETIIDQDPLLRSSVSVIARHKRILCRLPLYGGNPPRKFRIEPRSFLIGDHISQNDYFNAPEEFFRGKTELVSWCIYSGELVEAFLVETEDGTTQYAPIRLSRQRKIWKDLFKPPYIKRPWIIIPATAYKSVYIQVPLHGNHFWQHHLEGDPPENLPRNKSAGEYEMTLSDGRNIQVKTGPPSRLGEWMALGFYYTTDFVLGRMQTAEISDFETVTLSEPFSQFYNAPETMLFTDLLNKSDRYYINCKNLIVSWVLLLNDPEKPQLVEAFRVIMVSGEIKFLPISLLKQRLIWQDCDDIEYRERPWRIVYSKNRAGYVQIPLHGNMYWKWHQERQSQLQSSTDNGCVSSSSDICCSTTDYPCIHKKVPIIDNRNYRWIAKNAISVDQDVIIPLDSENGLIYQTMEPVHTITCSAKEQNAVVYLQEENILACPGAYVILVDGNDMWQDAYLHGEDPSSLTSNIIEYLLPLPEIEPGLSGLCVICQDEKASHTAVPCGHLCSCEMCSKKKDMQKTCPLCRTPLSSWLKTYIVGDDAK